MAQPNASRAIRLLERRFGMALVERSPRGSKLTAQGTVIVHWARQVLADVERLLDAAAALRVERDAQLTVGSSMTVAEYLMPQWLGNFRRLNPMFRSICRCSTRCKCSSASPMDHATSGSSNDLTCPTV